MKNKQTPSHFGEWITVERLGVILAAAGVVFLVVGSIERVGYLNLRQLWLDLYANVGTGLIDIAITVLLIDRLARAREQRAELRRLIREMGSRDNGTALRAVDDLRARGAISDGTLAAADLKYANLDGAIMAQADLRGAYFSFAKMAGADLRNANLEGAILRAADLTGALLINTNLNDIKLLDANLQSANLHGASLRGANLAGADLTEARGLSDERLAETHSLLRALMPTGACYDGRYQLAGDIRGMDTTNMKAMAAHYDVSPAAYRKGQEWAAQHSKHTHRE